MILRYAEPFLWSPMSKKADTSVRLARAQGCKARGGCLTCPCEGQDNKERKERKEEEGGRVKEGRMEEGRMEGSRGKEGRKGAGREEGKE